MSHPLDSITLLSYASGLGAGIKTCERGPLQLRHSSYLESVQHCLNWHNPFMTTNSSKGLKALPAITDLLNQLATIAAKLVQENQFFITLGGDHSCAIGTWSGVASAIAPKSLGLIWIDAHLDSHTPETTPSGNIHGMPVASLLGSGPTQLTHILNSQPKLRPENLCFIGIRSYESAEQQLLESLNVRVFYIEEIQQRGMTTVIKEAIAHIKRHSDYLGVSIDLDAISPEFAPGVGTPEANGISPQSLYQGLNLILEQKELIAAEIAEYNPDLDRANKTEQIAANLITQITHKRTHCKD